MEGKQRTAQELRHLLATDQAWVEQAILALYGFQTRDEQYSHATRELNGVGFNRLDANFLSSLARWLSQGRHLTERQFKAAKRLVPKYWGQLTWLDDPAPYVPEARDPEPPAMPQRSRPRTDDEELSFLLAGAR